jgi:hypothetical protein
MEIALGILAAVTLGGFALFAVLLQRIDNGINRLETKFASLETKFHTEFAGLRRDLAEEFRAQRAEVSAQVSAIANAITATRQ